MKKRSIALLLSLSLLHTVSCFRKPSILNCVVVVGVTPADVVVVLLSVAHTKKLKKEIKLQDVEI